MITQQDEVDVDVQWEDQQMINSFGRHNQRLHEIEDELKERELQVNNIQDASSELLLTDDDSSSVKVRRGDVFVEITKDEAEELLNDEEEQLGKEIEELNSERDMIKKILNELKVKLYAKFKNSINLEE